MERQTITVDIAPGNSQVERLGSSQGDIGRPLGVYIIQNGVALDCSAYSAELYILKPDGKFYTTLATVDSTETNLIKWETALQETPVAGACVAQIRITAGDDDIGTARFVEFVEASPCDMGSASESEVALLTEYVRQAHESAASAGRDATTASGAASSASGSASTATTAANTATQAATTATAAADRAEAVEESIPEDYSQLSDDVSGLKSAFEQLDANVITESAGPSTIVSIADGADGMPMRSVEVAIEPVQDLHGYDAPWPAGGGKNILPPLTSETKNGVSIAVAGDGTITVNGTASENTYFDAAASGVIPNNTTFYLYAFNPVASTDSNSMSIFIITDNGNPQTNLNNVNASISYSYTNGDKQISKWRFKVPAGVAYTNFVLKPMLQIGGTAPTAYSPYSNICPISGWTGAKVTRTGKNLLDLSLLFRVNNNVFRTRIFMLQAGSYVFSRPTVYGSNYSWYVRSVETEQYSTFTNLVVGGENIAQGAFTLSQSSLVYLEFYKSSGIPDNTITDLQLELSSTGTATDHEPYQGQTYDITFPTEAGTVYGGTLDVVSGKLVVDRAYLEKDANAWTAASLTGRFYTDFGTTNQYVSYNENISNIAKNAPYSTLGNNEFYVQSGYRVQLQTPYTSKEEFVSALGSTPCVMCLKLISPIEYTLTPQEIKTLLGVNNVCSDAGNTAITYPADTKRYIDKKIAELQALILENNG